MSFERKIRLNIANKILVHGGRNSEAFFSGSKK